MSSRAVTVVLFILAITSLSAFAYILRQLSFVSVGLAAHDEVEEQLRHSLEDQKKLARLDPANSAEYRRRFEESAGLVRHLRIMQFNRGEMARHVEQLLLGVVGLIVACGIALYLVERRSREARLVRLESALDALSRGDGEIVLGERRRDVIGRIAAAIEKSSRASAQDRRRLRYLEHLSAWQEAARRHAHEMRTPLTAARMDVERLVDAVRRRAPELSTDVDGAQRSILEELDRLREFTRSFTSFATIPNPRPRPLDLRRFLSEFCVTFAPAWPDIRLEMQESEEAAMVNADGEMLRQVLVNLATNSALAIGDRGGTLAFRLFQEGGAIHVDVADDGPGVAPEVRARLFEPYTTTRGIGEGMGLGLAISRKIMLDHDGDLDLIDSTSGGATFRLTLPALEARP